MCLFFWTAIALVRISRYIITGEGTMAGRLCQRESAVRTGVIEMRKKPSDRQDI